MEKQAMYIIFKSNIDHSLDFFKLVITPCKAEQPLQGMELHEKEGQKDQSLRKTCLKRSYKATNAGAELPPVCTSIYIHFLFRNWFFDSKRVRKNKCHFLGHGWLARNSPEIAWAGQKSYQIHISLTDGRRNLVDHSKWPQDLI